ncbi:hypothetical protein [Dyella flagellata]|uniref:CopG family transcriptional regulator n=1 Tax=Dyella flagellata TaxID=1867833 RepID=A0ABQ5XDP5_9GAMM|nr:hypothetical protein [Dyella flagellata]GLQ89750.1 hypothetical protein GCM10007898_33250 [Dyella flagellata]
MTAKKTNKREHASFQSRKRHGHVQVLLDQQLRDYLRYIALTEHKTFVALLNELAQKKIRSWEKSTGESIEDIFKSATPLLPENESR